MQSENGAETRLNLERRKFRLFLAVQRSVSEHPKRLIATTAGIRTL